MFLEKIKFPEDVKKIKKEDYPILAKEIRTFLIKSLSTTGGHLASNLGVVELSIALFHCLNLDVDKIIWDVGHQSYTHKILSGRKDAFDTLRKYKGLSGFPKTSESKYDSFNTGHASTSISAGLGFCYARDLKKEKRHIVSVIGDGALTGGLSYEALNNAARLKKNFIIILNDNDMSISKNIGGISNYLNSIRTDINYAKFKKSLVDILEKVPMGKLAIKGLKTTKDSIKHLFVPGMFFENMGLTYLGPIDAHNINGLIKVINEAKKVENAVIIHIISKKGKGYLPAEKEPEKFHGVSSFDLSNGNSKSNKGNKDYSSVFSESMLEVAKDDEKVVAITAAMPEGTGLLEFSKKYPNRFFDVGIAEAHAVTMAAGMAISGLKPVVAIYSSFLQRAFDQIIHDVCLQNLPILFAIDRAGLVGADGETHQGIFDISYLSLIPNITIFAPRNHIELKEGIKFLLKLNKPTAIRYPRGEVCSKLSDVYEEIEYAKAEYVYKEEEIALISIGSMFDTSIELRESLKKENKKVSLINLRFIKPLDYKLLDELIKNHSLIVTLEENVLKGGVGESISSYLQNQDNVKVINIGIDDQYVEQGDISSLKRDLQIDSDAVYKKIKEFYDKRET